MATESISDRREHVRSIGVTAVTALIGIGAALLSFTITGEPATEEAAKAAAVDQRTYLIVFAAILVQIPAIKASGIYDPDEFGAKLYLFIAFMTFCFWFVTWGVLLSTVY